MINTNKCFYYYLVVLKKHVEALGTLTTTDDSTGQTQEHECLILLSSSPEIVTGYVLAENDEKAYQSAKDELLKKYPLRDGYREHEKVKVQKTEE